MLSPEEKEQLDYLKEKLGRRRYRVAFLHFGRGLLANDISRRLRISKKTVYRDLAAAHRQFDQLERVKVSHRHRLVPLHPGIAAP